MNPRELFARLTLQLKFSSWVKQDYGVSAEGETVMLTRAAALGLAVFLLVPPVSIAAPQAPPNLPAPPKPGEPQVIRSTTRLVQISVITQDGKGEPISGLKKENFTILDGDKPQNIAVFSCESPAPAAPPVHLPANYFTNRFDLKGEDPGAVTVILFDSLNTASQDQTYVRRQILRLLETLKPQDHVGIYALTNNLIILQDFTQDAAALVNAVTKFTPKELAAFDASTAQPLDFASLTGDPQWQGFQNALNNAEGQINDQNTLNRIGTTAGALEAIADHVATIPGRKSLIWVSGGFPIQIGMSKLGASQISSQAANSSGSGGDPRTAAGRGQSQPVGGGDPKNQLPRADRETGEQTGSITEATRALNRVNMVIYPVDAHGVELSAGMDPNGRSASLQPSLSSGGFFGRQDTHDSSRLLAEETGGKAFYGTNDIRGAVRSALDDGRYACTVGFYPDHGKWDGSFRGIKVTTDVAGAHLRYRKGYYAFKDLADSPEAVKADLQHAALSPLETTSLGMIVNGKPMQPLSDRKLQLQIALDPKQFLLKESDSHQKGGLDMVFLQRDTAGNILAADEQHFDINFVKQQYEYLAKAGIVLERHVTVQPGSNEIRVVVRDAGSGASGSVTVPVKAFFPVEASPAGVAKPPN
jgi:VWFA-related protein